ncbi:MAG: glycosyltransferase [Thermomicrobiales bacterium]
MRRLRILIWHVHGSYLNALAHIEHDWFLPVKPGNPTGYAGRGRTFDMPDWVQEVPAASVADLDLDLVVYQTPDNLFVDGPSLLGERQWSLPAIYLEHNTPKPDAVHTAHPATAHPAVETRAILVHVTQFNKLMWDNGGLPTRVIEHSVIIDPSIRYRGNRQAGIVVANHMERRPRITGFDILQQARRLMPIDVAGMGTENYGGLGDIPYRCLHRKVAEYRFLFSPMRYTSLPLAVVEAMHIGMPVVALATTELPTVIEDGVSGYLSCDPEVLYRRMQDLLADSALAHRIGEKAQKVARRRFAHERFTRDWNDAFREAIERRRTSPSARITNREPTVMSGIDARPHISGGRL